MLARFELKSPRGEFSQARFLPGNVVCSKSISPAAFMCRMVLPVVVRGIACSNLMPMA
ncbi:MAG: hypothetical protein ACI8W7_003669 [Gammaproteobacteria bacterium]|jgi:hypothetical protein